MFVCLLILSYCVSRCHMHTRRVYALTLIILMCVCNQIDFSQYLNYYANSRCSLSSYPVLVWWCLPPPPPPPPILPFANVVTQCNDPKASNVSTYSSTFYSATPVALHFEIIDDIIELVADVVFVDVVFDVVIIGCWCWFCCCCALLVIGSP